MLLENLHFQCVNGTLYDELCENGLAYSGGHGAAHNFCNYNWEVDCGTRAYDDTPISSPGKLIPHLKGLKFKIILKSIYFLSKVVFTNMVFILLEKAVKPHFIR